MILTKKSVNHHIPDEFCSVKYHDLDEAIQTSLKLEGSPIYYGKTDISNAFRLVPLKGSCRKWLLMKTENPETGEIQFFVEKCLSFGSSISCAIFQRFSNAIKHIFMYKVSCQGLTIWVINYLDDFLFIQIKRLLCDDGIQQFLELCEHIGILVALDKTEWSSEKVVFLGMLLDGKNLIIAIPDEKRRKVTNMLELMVSSRKSTVKNLQRLAGFLNFLNKAYLSG